jgi:hypothetical protein
MPDPYEVDDEGNPVAQPEAIADAAAGADSAPDAVAGVDAAAPAADPAEVEALRRQVETTLRFVALSTVVGVVVIAILAALISGSRGVLILVGLVYLVTSTVAYFVLRRNLNARLARYESAGTEAS